MGVAGWLLLLVSLGLVFVVDRAVDDGGHDFSLFGVGVLRLTASIILFSSSPARPMKGLPLSGGSSLNSPGNVPCGCGFSGMVLPLF